MARPDGWETSPLYRAAARFVDAALRKRDSMFTPGRPIWAEGPVEDFYQRFVVHADETEGRFEERLQRQLAGAPPETAQLAAELLFIYLLPANRARGRFKRGLIGVALGSCGVSLPPELDAALEQGMASEGQGFHQQRFYYLRYLLEFVRGWWQKNASEREWALTDPWAFKAAANEINVPSCQSQREILLHIVHPETFEDILAHKHKHQIVTAFADLVNESTDDIDRQLLIIRQRLTEQGKAVQYYEPPLSDVWQGNAGEASASPDRTTADARVRYWKIAPGANARLWDECLRGGYISVGWDELGDLSHMDRALFEAAQARAIAEHSDFTPKGTAQVWTFAKEIKPGDRIVANHGMFKVVGIGTVTGAYMYVADAPEHAHRIPVRWDDVRPREVNQRGWRPTIMELDKENFEQICRMTARQPTAKGPLESLLVSRKNVVLYGPPGTGKTHASLQLARTWAEQHGEDSVWQVTFHPSFAYEDFIEGFRPDASGKFELRKGIFVQAAEAAHAKPDVPFLLVIDELNRGDVARLFGELITLIEADKRRVDMKRKLPYSQLDFWVPPNLHLLGTMNTADRSISLLDIAIRRRFCFVEYRPDGGVIRKSPAHCQEVEGVDLADLMEAINGRLERIGVDRDRAIGHCHFLIPREHAEPLGLLRQRLRYDILPLVEEYCYADRSRAREVFGKLVGEDGRGNEGIIGDDELLTRELLRLAARDGEVAMPEGNGDGMPVMDRN